MTTFNDDFDRADGPPGNATVGGVDQGWGWDELDADVDIVGNTLRLNPAFGTAEVRGNFDLAPTQLVRWTVSSVADGVTVLSIRSGGGDGLDYNLRLDPGGASVALRRGGTVLVTQSMFAFTVGAGLPAGTVLELGIVIDPDTGDGDVYVLKDTGITALLATEDVADIPTGLRFAAWAQYSFNTSFTEFEAEDVPAGGVELGAAQFRFGARIGAMVLKPGPAQFETSADFGALVFSVEFPPAQLQLAAAAPSMVHKPALARFRTTGAVTVTKSTTPLPTIEAEELYEITAEEL